MKRTGLLLCIFSVIIYLFCLVACSNYEEKGSHFSHDEQLQNEKNELLSFYDNDDSLITTVEHYNSITQTDTGFIYSKLSSESEKCNVEVEYYSFDFLTKKTATLGTIADWSYEASYDTICTPDHVYMLISTGNTLNFKNVTNYICDINLTQSTMMVTMINKGTSPYNSMALVGDEIYISSPGKDVCFISKYNTKTQKITRIKEFRFDIDSNSGETIRHICSDDKYIYLLRLVMEHNSKTHMYIDQYDYSFKSVISIEVTDEVVKYTLEADNRNAELQQLVSKFIVKNGYVYYENFSITRALFEMPDLTDYSDDIKVRHLIEASPSLFEATGASTDKIVFYESYSNDIFSLDTITGKIQKCSFKTNGMNCSITFMTRNSKNELLIFTEGSSIIHDTNEHKVYYLSSDDLEKCD